jgi:glycosyltransferase involved in cell wall biosynthesis
MPQVRVARVIGRLNIGGPAVQAITLTKLLEPRGYVTRLIRGSEASHEGTLDDMARRYGVQPHLIAGLRRDLHPSDARAVGALVRQLRAFRPHIVHTHLAKAGALGRTAALLSGLRPRPAIVHTYHGHSLEGYFSPGKQAIFRGIERTLSHRSDRVVAVAPEVADDLVRLGVVPRERIEVIPVGFDLSPFVIDGAERQARGRAVRDQWGVPADAPLVTLVARLVPIKRVDRFLRIAERLVARHDEVWLAIVGDGELRSELEATAMSDALRRRLTWAGFRRDVPDVCFASDVVVLTSDNEGTPVSLIEAQAAGVPVVGTRVGGTATAVRDGISGHLVAPEDEAGFADAVARLLGSPATGAMGAAGRRHALAAFSLERLVDDVDALYRRLLAARGLA